MGNSNLHKAWSLSGLPVFFVSTTLTGGMSCASGEGGVSYLNTVTAVPAGNSNCAEGGVRIDNGVDTDGDGALSITEVISTHYICHGTNVLSTLTHVSEEPFGENCTAGGVRVDIGKDINSSGKLDAEEVSETHYICHGANGIPETPPDAGALVDAGVWADVGTSVDAGVLADAGVWADAGTSVDAGTSIDAGTSVDAGVLADAGVLTDAGTSIDAGILTDAGTSVDAGILADAGTLTCLPGGNHPANQFRSVDLSLDPNEQALINIKLAHNYPYDETCSTPVHSCDSNGDCEQTRFCSIFYWCHHRDYLCDNPQFLHPGEYDLICIDR